jgi:hypothetical protein
MWFNRDFELELEVESRAHYSKKMFVMMTEEKKQYTVQARQAASPAEIQYRYIHLV